MLFCGRYLVDESSMSAPSPGSMSIELQLDAKSMKAKKSKAGKSAKKSTLMVK